MPSLREIQHWFGPTIAKPPSIMPTDAEVYIASQEASARMQIYQQQYWFRLLGVLHESFPLLLRLYGHEDFNASIGIPYLTDCPPNTWELNRIGERLSEWLSDPISKLAAQIDWAFERSFVAAARLSIQGDPNILLDASLQLQPYLELHHADRNLLAVRDTFLAQEVDYWLDHDFPRVERSDFYAAIYRTHWRSLAPGEYRILTSIAAGQSLRLAVQQLDDAPDLAYWVQDWVLRGWLYSC